MPASPDVRVRDFTEVACLAQGITQDSLRTRAEVDAIAKESKGKEEGNQARKGRSGLSEKEVAAGE